jgi:hypothetical protein
MIRRRAVVSLVMTLFAVATKLTTAAVLGGALLLGRSQQRPPVGNVLTILSRVCFA